MSLENNLKCCTSCPHKCRIDRYNTHGRCKMGSNVKLSLVSIHNFEEPIISGKNGSGTIFFTGCNLECVYCQNYKISSERFGKEITIDRLANIMLEQEKRGAENINLVTPTIYAYQIKEAIKIAKKKGLKIPIVYNSGGYDLVSTLKELDGYIDIYLPDLKYSSDELGKRYSCVNDYFTRAKEAIMEMRRQVKDTYDENGMLKTGLIIRHMILPNNIENSKKVIKWIKDNLGEDTIISIMAQYFPEFKAKTEEYKEINRKITKEELVEIENYLFEKNMTNGFIQELGEHEEEYVPEFNLDNV